MRSATKIILFCLATTIFQFVQAQAPAEISLEELKSAYNNFYLASHTDSIGWKAKGVCDPGSIPKELYSKAEKRINFFRLMNRLPLIKITSAKQKEAQAAALMMERNNSLSHNPPASWKCYTKEGADGAKNSCLGITNFKHLKHTAFITGFIADPGNQNYFVGHRRWLLYSRATEFSFGATRNAIALYSTSNLSDDTVKNSFIAYPWAGYVPVDLIFSKWSFAIPETNEVDYTKTKVSVTTNKGVNLPVEVLKEEKNAPDRVITWKIKGLFSEEEEKYSKNSLKEKGYAGQELKVKIENVSVNGKLITYGYSVRIVEL